MKNSNKFFIGLNLNHNSSLSVHDSHGNVLFAAEEERYNRHKNSTSFPISVLKDAIKTGFVDPKSAVVDQVVIGSNLKPNSTDIRYWMNVFYPSLWDVNFWKVNPFLISPGRYPEYYEFAKKYKNSENFLRDHISKIFNELGIECLGLSFVCHHDSHSASGLFSSGYGEAVALSLDGTGDDESGVIQFYRNDKYQNQLVDYKRIPNTHSLGLVYSEVTKRYGFKEHLHEGKITGLAALGSYSEAVEYLFNCIKIVNGKPELQFSRNRFSHILNRILFKAKLNRTKTPNSISQMIEIAVSQTHNYADLEIGRAHV